ncbi:16S rRNA (uracil(1498)-N(3))-methyltransferase [Vagococcus coleopterorum]|uniref:Ribosomal RNA small subunit methyltransferase E n=1 Tax=Vagococcus coleopterorum TaxID=2714946 RepID=A0A6G8AMB3_9ENTE|nr:16S rRNA (uracil(1498)-N(3))-methyltransferase [Vagococcus coleopterorum]QIL46099.1 16S rRNA (uracil(1498)-N(3))-methyltransferase [Vagococcus coleopterorum]
MQRYFVTQSYADAQENGFKLTGDDYHHAVNVMRMKVKDHCFLVFTDQRAIIGEIINISEEDVEFKEISKESQNKELPVHVTIASGYPKGDKLELVVQKGTELGASEFVGFPAKSSVVKWDAKKLAKKGDRLVKIAKEAAEQSHRQFQPTVKLLTSEKELLELAKDYDHVLIAYEEAAKSGEQGQLVKTLSVVKPGESILVVFGPEGGLTPQEVGSFETAGGKVCALGPRILRTETAPFYLLSAISYQLELLT